MRPLIRGMCVVLPFVLTACATLETVPLTTDGKVALKGKTVAAVYYEPSKYSWIGQWTITDLKPTYDKLSIYDPAPEIGEGLLKRLAAYGAHPTPSGSVFYTQDKAIETLAKDFPKADYLLDVKSNRGGIGANFAPFHSTSVRLYDLHAGRVVASYACDKAGPVAADEGLFLITSTEAQREKGLIDFYRNYASLCVDETDNKILNP